MPTKRIAVMTAIVTILGLGIAGLTYADPYEGGRGGWGGGPGWGHHRSGEHHGPAMGGWGRHMGFGRGFGYGRHFATQPLVSMSLALRDELKLSADQVTKLEDLRDGFARRVIKEQAEIQTMRLDLRRALAAEKPNLDEAEKQIRAIAQKRADLRVARLRTIDAGRAVLTAEQQKQLRELTARRFAGRFGGGGGFGPGMMGPGGGPGMMGPGGGPPAETR